MEAALSGMGRLVTRGQTQPTAGHLQELGCLYSEIGRLEVESS